MLKKRISIGIAVFTLASTLCMGSSASAYENTFSRSVRSAEKSWYGSTITLPRMSWWYTTARNATVVNQGTGVDSPSYTVLAKITNGSNEDLTNPPKIHEAGRDTVNWHYTNRKGSDVKAAFRSSFSTIHTNRVDLRWKP